MTRPLIFQGRSLHVNADSRKGSIAAEILEARQVDSADPAWNWKIGEPVPGFGRADCIPLDADSTDAVIRWRGDPSLEPFAGKPMAIRFHLTRASFFSFWIQ